MKSNRQRKRRTRTPEQHNFELALSRADRALKQWAAWTSGSAAVDNSQGAKPYRVSLAELVLTRRGDDGYRPTFTHPIRQPVTIGLRDDVVKKLTEGSQMIVEGWALVLDPATGEIWATKAPEAPPPPSDRRHSDEFSERMAAAYTAGSYARGAETAFTFTGSGPKETVWLRGDQLEAIDRGCAIYAGRLHIWRSSKGRALLARRIRSLTAKGKQTRSGRAQSSEAPPAVRRMDRIYRQAPEHVKTLLRLQYLMTRLTSRECAERAGYQGKSDYYANLRAARAYVLGQLEHA